LGRCRLRLGCTRQLLRGHDKTESLSAATQAQIERDDTRVEQSREREILGVVSFRPSSVRCARATDGGYDIGHRLAGEGCTPPLWQRCDLGLAVTLDLRLRLKLGVEQPQCVLGFPVAQRVHEMM
jgi:hypothetical protein